MFSAVETQRNADRLHPTKISVVIPSRDRPDLIEAQWGSALKEFVARGGQVVFVDHASVKNETARTLAKLEKAGAVVVRETGRFNFSRLINSGILRSQRPYIFALNDDVKLRCAEDIVEICMPLCDPTIGAVGATLLSEDGLLQHAGVVVGGEGLATHIGRGINPALVVNDDIVTGLRVTSAVTAAAIAFRRSDFDRVSGFCEKQEIELNDIDFCLRIGALDLKIVVNTNVKLVHPELTSRGDPLDGPFANQIRRDRHRFLKRWYWRLSYDPCYPLALSNATSQIVPRFPPAIGVFPILKNC